MRWDCLVIVAAFEVVVDVFEIVGYEKIVTGQGVHRPAPIAKLRERCLG